MSLPLVSVIVATFRRTDKLKAALDSLSNQTYKNMEIILVDDNGDGEWNLKIKKIVNHFSTDNNNIPFTYIVNDTNQGSAKTRNIGIEAANGEYVTFLDDDDVYLPEKIEKQLQNMISFNSDYGITDLYLYSEGEKLIDRRIRSYIKKTTADDLMRYHLMYHITGTDTMMFRKEYLKKIGGFDLIDVGDEFYLMQKAILGGGKFNYLPECYVKAYVHTGDGGLSSGEGKINGENALYKYKQTFFDKIDQKSRRYINMRHYAVLAYAYLRMKKYGSFLLNAIKAVATAPFQCVKLAIDR